jgi:hypothetical protein
VERQIRKVLPQTPENAQILYQDRVYPGLIGREKQSAEILPDLPLLQKGIHRQVQLHSMEMAILNGLDEALPLWVFRVSPGTEGARPGVDRIRSGIDRRFDALKAPARRSQLHLSFQ